MHYDVWFVPSNSSHIAKNRLLLEALRQRGCNIRMLCLDDVLPEKFWTRRQMEASGYAFEVLPANGFRPDRHRLFQGLQRGPLVRSLKRFFETYPVDAMIFGSETEPGSQAPGDVAKRLGFPTVLIVDGVIAPRNPRYTISLGQKLRRAAVLLMRRVLRTGASREASSADLLLVMNELGRRELIRLGVDESRLRVVGSPEYDALARQVRSALPDLAQSIRSKLGLPPRRPVILFAHQDISTNEARAAMIEQSITRMIAAARQCDATVLVKLHPRGRQRADEWRDWAAQREISDRDALFVLDECTSVEAVQICSICVTFFSTVCIEAMVCRKPVIFMVYHGYRDTLTAQVLGAGLDARSPEDLEERIVGVLSEPSLTERLIQSGEAYLEREMFGVDGRSVERSVEAILGLMESASPFDQRRRGGERLLSAGTEC